jgi:putative ABC transport system permease protein
MKYDFKKHLSHYFPERLLAWAQLSHQTVRLTVAMTGVCFANILMFSQLGLRTVLFDGITQIHEKLTGDLFLISAYSPTLGERTFPKIFLYQAQAVDGVGTVFPLYIGASDWINPEDLKTASPTASLTESKPATRQAAETPEPEISPEEVKVLAFNPTQPVLNMPEIEPYLGRLSTANSLLFDRLSQPDLGPISQLLSQSTEVVTIMDNQRVRILDTFALGSNLFIQGHVIMSDLNYARIKGNGVLDQVSVGVITLEPGADPLAIQANLQAKLPAKIKVLTRQELIQKEKDYWSADPSGIVLTFGAVMGFIVGVIVVYQILYSDVTDHLPEYATLKAIGYSDRSLLIIVLQEAVILAVLGFMPGYAASVGVYHLLSQLTRIPLVMRPDVVVQVFVLTVFMCKLAGVIAMQKLRTADPADVF